MKKLYRHALTPAFLCAALLCGCSVFAVEKRRHKSTFEPAWKLAGEKIEIIKNGKPNAVIVVADAPDRISHAAVDKSEKPWREVYRDTNYAAGELVSYIRKSTGVELKIVTASQAPDDGNLLLVGRSDLTDRYKITCPEAPESFVISTFQRGVAIVGEIAPVGAADIAKAVDRGTLHGVYAFLENVVGCRFYFYCPEDPDLGFAIPVRKDISIFADYAVYEAPDFQHRLGGAVNTDGDGWMPVTRKGTSTYFIANHTDEQWGLHFRKEHPEFFAVMQDGSRHHEKICYTSPDAFAKRVEIVDGFFENGSWRGGWVKPNRKYIPMVPSDHQLWEPCLCAGCMALYDRGRGRYGKKSDIIFSHGKKLAETAGERWPDKRISMLAYAAYMIPPTFELPDNLDVMVCLWMSPLIGKEDYVHDFNMNLMRRWSRKLGDSRDRLYVWNYPCWPGNSSSALFICPNYLQKWYRDCHEYSSGEFLNSSMKNLQVGHLMNYAWFRLLWNRDLDMQHLIEEYCRILFGPAGEPMHDFYRLVIDRYENIKWSEKLPHWYPTCELLYGETYPPEVLDKVEDYLRQADASCSKDIKNIYRRRIEWMKEGLREFIDNGRFVHKCLAHPAQYKVATLATPPGKLDDWENIESSAFISDFDDLHSGIDTGFKMIRSGTDLHVLFEAEEPTTPKNNDRFILEFFPKENLAHRKIYRANDHFELEYVTPPEPERIYFSIGRNGISDGVLDAGLVLNEHKNGKWSLWVRFPKTKLEKDGKLPPEIAAQVKRIRSARSANDYVTEHQHHGKYLLGREKTYLWQPQLKPGWPEFNLKFGRIIFSDR